jgi:hypothetical protein
MAILAPELANLIAVALPSPELPPTISAMRSLRRSSAIVVCGSSVEKERGKFQIEAVLLLTLSVKLCIARLIFIFVAFELLSLKCR